MSFLRLVTRKYKPPPPKEINIVEPITIEDPVRTNRTSIADRMLDYVKDDIELFIDQRGEGYARLKNGHVVKLRSMAFSAYLREMLYTKEQKALNPSSLKNIAEVLEAIAISKKKEHVLSVRVAQRDDIFYLDLGNGRIIQIDKTGWKVLTNAPIAFRSFSHQTDHVLPSSDYKIDDLLQFFNFKDPKEHLLFIAYLVSCFVPNISHPVIVLSGDQGSAKSTFFRLVKRLIDPSRIELFAPPKNINEFIQIEDHHYCIFLDNLTDLPEWLSDALCRGCTGEGFSKRRLFSDDEDIFFSFKRCLGINGINQIIDKPDLLDRALLFNLERIPDKERKKDHDLINDFNALLPNALGSLLTIFAKAIAHYDKVRIETLPRMADFAFWGCAISLALGYTEQDFLDRYNNNIRLQNTEALDASPIASVIIEYMTDKTNINLTASELYADLCQYAENMAVNTRLKTWPKDPKWLWKRIKEVRPNLIKIGINAEKTDDRCSYIKLSKDRQHR